MDLALFLNMKQVLSQRYVQTLIDRIWRGDVGSAMYPLPLRYSWGYYLKVPIYFLSLGLLSPPVRGYLMGRRRQRQVAPVFIFDAFTKAKKLLEFQMDEAVKREEETNKQVADGEQAPSPTRQSSTTVPRISDTTRARCASRLPSRASTDPPASGGELSCSHRGRYRSKVSEAFDHAHMEGSVDDGFTSDDVVSSWVLSQLSGWELLGNFIAYWHIPAIKFMLRVYIDLILCFLYLLTIMSNPTIEQLDELRDSCEGKGPGCFSRPFSHTKEPVLSASPQTTGNIPVVELTLYIVGFSIMFDSMYINVRRTNGLDFEAGADAGVRFFTYMKLWRRIMLVTSLVLRLLAVNADWDYTLRRQLYTANGYIMAFATFFAFFHLLEAFSQSEDVSVLVIMIARMMDDLIVFLKLAIIIILSFTASFVGLEWVGSMDLSDEEPNLQEEMAVDFEQSQQTPVHLGDGNIEEHFGYGPSFSSRLFRFGYGLSEDQSGNAFSRGDEAKPGFPIGVPMWGFIGEVGPLDSFDTVADIWMWIFVFVSTVILVNLLVAMFADTYSHTKENSKTEALAARYRRIFEHKRLMTVLPPPLNLPYVLFFLSCHYLKAAVNGCSAVCGLCFRGTAKYRVGVMPTAALNAFVSGASGKNLVQDKARRKEALIERSVKQYVERFLEYKEQEQAESVESVVRNTSEHVGAMQESFASKLNLLTDKVDKLVAAMEASQPSQGSGGGVSYSIG